MSLLELIFKTKSYTSYTFKLKHVDWEWSIGNWKCIINYKTTHKITYPKSGKHVFVNPYIIPIQKTREQNKYWQRVFLKILYISFDYKKGSK